MRPVAIFALLFSCAFARTAQAETLTLEDALRQASSASPRVREARANVDGSRATVSLARSVYLPDVNFAAAATAGFGGSTHALGVRGLMNSPYTQHFGAGVEAGWTVYDFGRTAAHVDAALAGVDAAKARGALSARVTALEVLQAFEAAVTAEEDVRATAAVIELRARGAAAAQSLAAAGVRPALEVLVAIARAEEARAALEVARAELEAARFRLGALLGRPLAASTALVAAEPSKGDVERAVSSPLAASRDPSHDAADAELARARALDRAASAEHRPRLVVAGSAGYARRVSPDEPGYWAAGVGIVVPLLGFVREEARARAATADAQAASARAHQADLELRAQLGREAALLRTFAASVAAADASVAAAGTVLSAAEARYAAGQLSFVEVDAARDAVIRAESTRRRLTLRGALSLARVGVWSGRWNADLSRQ